MSNENKKKAEHRLIQLLKAEVEAVSTVVLGDSHEEEANLEQIRVGVGFCRLQWPNIFKWETSKMV